MSSSLSPAPLGVVVVTFNATDVILDCLESLLAIADTPLRIVVVDNASPDNTAEFIRDWAAGRTAYTPSDDLPFPITPAPKPLALNETADPAPLTLIAHSENSGYAGGVNIGLAHLMAHGDLENIWVLNPDSITAPDTPAAYLAKAAATPDYGLMGGRTCYMDPPDLIQIDGGLLNRKTGVTGNLNQGKRHGETPAPADDTLDFIMGGNMVASRAFLDAVGLMEEDYFLYYEEVDWAFRRGDLPLVYCEDGLVHHRAGTAIGSRKMSQVASPLSMYFKYRGRLRFMRRFFPKSLLTAYGFALVKLAQTALQGHRQEAWAGFAGLVGLRPPKAVSARLSRAALAATAAPVSRAKPGSADKAA